MRENLVKLIHYMIANTSNPREGAYRVFWECVDKHNRNISIITMNYDTLLDEAFDFLFSKRALIDYCLEFMNYSHMDLIDGFDWWENPREKITVFAEDDDPKPIKILKIHGSLNWKYCNCCNQVLLTPWNTSLDLKSMMFMTKENEGIDSKESEKYVCPIDENPLNTFIAVSYTHLTLPTTPYV